MNETSYYIQYLFAILPVMVKSNLCLLLVCRMIGLLTFKCPFVVDTRP